MKWREAADRRAVRSLGGAASRVPAGTAPPAGSVPLPVLRMKLRDSFLTRAPLKRQRSRTNPLGTRRERRSARRRSARGGERPRDAVLRALRLAERDVAGEHGEREPAAVAGRAVARERADAARRQRARSCRGRRAARVRASAGPASVPGRPGRASAARKAAVRAIRRSTATRSAAEPRVARIQAGAVDERDPARRASARPLHDRRAGRGRCPGAGASALVSSSAIQSSDGRSIAATSSRTGADAAPASTAAPAGAVPARGTPWIVTPRASSTSSKRAAAARAGSACTGPSGVARPRR